MFKKMVNTIRCCPCLNIYKLERGEQYEYWKVNR